MNNKTNPKRNTSKQVKKYDLKDAMRFKQLKYADYFGNAFSSTTTIGYSTLTNVTQGPGQTQRVGDMVYLHHMEYRIHYTTANVDVFNLARLLFFVWVPNTGTFVPGTTSILEDPTTYGVLSPHNYETRQEYKVLYDSTFRMTGTYTNPTVQSNIERIGRINLGNKLQVFNRAASTGTGQIYFLHLSDSALTPFPTLSLMVRTYYYDA